MGLPAGLMLVASAQAGERHRPTLSVLDLRPAATLPAGQRYDVRHAAACLQGLANRTAPRIFVLFHDGDAVWLERLRERGGLCEAWNVRPLGNIDELLVLAEPYLKGAVLYDPDPDTGVTSTSLAATTAAGVEGAVAMRKDPAPGSLYHRWVQDPRGPRLPMVLDLTGRFSGEGTIWQTDLPSSGSAKCDAYLWAKSRYLDTGQCDPTTLSYTLDLWGMKVRGAENDQLSNLDYAVSRRGFCFELSPWGDEVPNDDPKQAVGTDLRTFKAILDACNTRTQHAKMIKFIGFVNWPFKYTKRQGGKHEDVETEWETARLLTAYNAYKEADAASPQWISNASFYHALLPAVRERRYSQNPPPTPTQMRQRGLIGPDGKVPPGNYMMVGMGDYDQASWTLYLLGGQRFTDPARGTATCNWGIDPNAVDRASVAMDWFYRHKSPRDFFICWDSGAGYVNPTQLHGKREPSGYPSAVRAWQEHCKHYYRMFDYSISGWLLNGSAGEIRDADYRHHLPFSGDGIGVQNGQPPGPLLVENVPVLERFPSDACPSPAIAHESGVHFAWYRTIVAWPRQIAEMEATANRAVNQRYLDAFTFYYLLRHHLGGHNDYRATWIADTIPRIMTAGRSYRVSVTVRNDGWDAWSEQEQYRLGCAIVEQDRQPTDADYDAIGHHPLAGRTTVRPGTTTTFRFELTAPKQPGEYDVYYDLVREGVTWFREQNNLEWKAPLIVAEDERRVDTDGDGRPDLWESANGQLWWHPDY
jgi:hypothetical protein